MSSLYRYNYYDSPDGKDLIKKLFYANKHVTIFGFGLASTEIIMLSKPVGYLNTMYRYGQLMGPMYAAASTFCIVSYTAQHIREKDDELNYAIGGFASGILVGPLIKNKMIGFWLGVAFAIIGATKKNSKIEGYEFHPTWSRIRPQVHGDFRTPYRNWTVYDQRPQGWLADEERKE